MQTIDITSNRHCGSTASEEAFLAVEPNRGKQREEIRIFLRACPRGATCKEISSLTGMVYTSVSARLAEMKASGEIIGTGIRRLKAEVVQLKREVY